MDYLKLLLVSALGLLSACATTPSHLPSQDEAITLANQGQFAESLALFKQIEKRHPRDPVLLADMAFLWSLLDENQRCVDYASDSLKISPGSVKAVQTKAVCLMALGESDDALSTLEILLQQDNDDAVVLGLAANAAFASGEHEMAIAYVNRVIKVLATKNMNTISAEERGQWIALQKDMSTIRRQVLGLISTGVQPSY